MPKDLKSRWEDAFRIIQHCGLTPEQVTDLVLENTKFQQFLAARERKRARKAEMSRKKAAEEIELGQVIEEEKSESEHEEEKEDREEESSSLFTFQ